MILLVENPRKGNKKQMQSYDQQNILYESNGVISSVVWQEDPQAYLEQNALNPAEVVFFYPVWQKALDISFGLFGLLVLLILLPFLAALIYLDSPGPIFYHQERVGYRGRKFFMHKFRSMHPASVSARSSLWGTANGSQVTRVGRILRGTHLDELPQVINILWGEMSLIGPRPEREVYVIELEKEDPQYCSRFLVKPGLTGWAQVRYGYGESYKAELAKLRYDLYYIEHRSCLLDMKIIFKTFVEVLRYNGDK